MDGGRKSKLWLIVDVDGYLERVAEDLLAYEEERGKESKGTHFQTMKLRLCFGLGAETWKLERYL